MRVLICIPCLLTGGTEIQTLNLVEALIRGGHQVTTVCYFEHTPNMVSRYQQAGSKVVCLSVTGKRIGGINGIIFLYKGLKQMIRISKPDITHVQYMAPGAIPILLLRLFGIKNIIATAHTAADIYPNLKLVHFIQRYCVRVFTCITQVAEMSFFGKSNLYTQKTVIQKVNHFTIYNVLPSYIKIREEQRDFSSPVTVGVVGRLEKIKGGDLVIPAFVRIKERYPETRLLIVGDGSLKAFMQQQAKDLHVSEYITWVGRKDQSQLQAYYDKIHVLLIPSRSEGFGLTAIEGMARGCVVIASKTGGLSEIVKDKEVGLLHDQENTEDLAKKVCYVLEHPQDMKMLSMKATRYVEQFGNNQYTLLFNDLYEKVTN